MSNKEKEDIYNLDFFYHPKKTTGRGHFVDSLRPVCVNIGCFELVHIQNYNGGKATYRSVCVHCHDSGRKGSLATYKEGVKPVKRDYCENYRGDLFPEYKCPTTHDKTQINMEGETGVVPGHMLDLDHIDGDHYNNDKENQQTLCRGGCHLYKTDKNGDYSTRGIHGTVIIRGEKIQKEDLRVPKAVPIEHEFFGDEE